MAITTTPLGFKKPDGNEPVRGGDNVIADNAQKAQDLIQSVSSRLLMIENGAVASGIMPDPLDPDTLLINTGSDGQIITDPSDADALIITT